MLPQTQPYRRAAKGRGSLLRWPLTNLTGAFQQRGSKRVRPESTCCRDPCAISTTEGAVQAIAVEDMRVFRGHYLYAQASSVTALAAYSSREPRSASAGAPNESFGNMCPTDQYSPQGNYRVSEGTACSLMSSARAQGQGPACDCLDDTGGLPLYSADGCGENMIHPAVDKDWSW